jgi:hypothetical protein
MATTPLIFGGAILAAFGVYAFVRSPSTVPVQARVTSVSENCYLRLKEGDGTRTSKLMPCGDIQALSGAFGGSSAQVVRTRAASLLFTSPSNGRPITVPVAEAPFSATPLKVGDVITIRSDTRFAGRVKPN